MGMGRSCRPGGFVGGGRELRLPGLKVTWLARQMRVRGKTWAGGVGAACPGMNCFLLQIWHQRAFPINPEEGSQGHGQVPAPGS